MEYFSNINLNILEELESFKSLSMAELSPVKKRKRGQEDSMEKAGEVKRHRVG